MYSSIGVFLQVFVEIIKFEANSHGLFNFSRKDSASKHALKTKFNRKNINPESPVFERRPLTTKLRLVYSSAHFSMLCKNKLFQL